MSERTAAMEEIVIRAGRSDRQYWRDLWRHRELLYFLAWRDVIVRYKQTVIGVAWALLRPLVTMVVFTIVFGRLAKLPSDGVPYAVLVLAAMVPWQFFANAFAEAGGSLVSNANMISKVYFPRLLVPASAVIANLVDMFLAGAVLCAALLWFGIMPSWHWIAAPAFVSMAALAALGGGLWVAALNVRYRDFRYVLPFLVQLGLFLSPVGFSSSIVPDQWRLLYALNPMVGSIDGFRWAVTGGLVGIHWTAVGVSALVTLFLVAAGVRYFRRTERTFADVI